MNVQVLIVTMNQNSGDYSLLDRMNIQSDAIICNQCDRNEFLEFDYHGYNIKWMSFAERGVGLNRNNGLMRATGDILLFADDDVQYVDNYDKIIVDFYLQHPDADMAIMNMSVRRNKDSTFNDLIIKTKKAKKYNLTRFGTVCITAKNDSLTFKNICFHRQFGGGAKYSCGEDSLFLQDCYNKKMKIYLVKDKIGQVENGKSTWFEGINDKYFFDKGVLYYAISNRWSKVFALYHCLKHRKLYEKYGWCNGWKKMCEGATSVKKRI